MGGNEENTVRQCQFFVDFIKTGIHMAASGVVAAAAAGTRGKHIVTQVDNFAGDVFPGGGLGNDCAKLQGGAFSFAV